MLLLAPLEIACYCSTTQNTQARILAWDIYRKWDWWIDSCCPAEEEQLRRRGRTFEHPEQFRHADEASPPPPPPSRRLLLDDGKPSQDSSAYDGAGGILAEHDAPTIAVRTVSAAGTTHVREPEEVRTRDVNGEDEPEPVTLRRVDTGHQSADNVAGQAAETAHIRTARDEQHGENEEWDFRPTAAMSAKAVVRERRQWALRRARRSEGPNEANQLELGGGGVCVSGSGSFTTTIHDGGVVALLVSQS